MLVGRLGVMEIILYFGIIIIPIMIGTRWIIIMIILIILIVIIVIMIVIVILVISREIGRRASGHADPPSPARVHWLTGIIIISCTDNTNMNININIHDDDNGNNPLLWIINPTINASKKTFRWLTGGLCPISLITKIIPTKICRLRISG